MDGRMDWIKDEEKEKNEKGEKEKKDEDLMEAKSFSLSFHMIMKVDEYFVRESEDLPSSFHFQRIFTIHLEAPEE